MVGEGKFVRDKNENLNFLRRDNFFFPKPILFHNSCIFLDFYLVLLKEICLRFIWSNGYSVKCPYIALHQCMYQFHLLHYTKKYKKYLSDIGGKWLYFIINMKPKGLDWNTKLPFVNSSSLKISLRDKLRCQLFLQGDVATNKVMHSKIISFFDVT